MRRLSRILVIFAALSAVSAYAESVEPDLQRMLREAQKPKVQYGPARVGWNGPEIQPGKVVNPTYESLRWDSPAAIRQELKSVLVPQWQFWLAFLAMIVGLRLLRATRVNGAIESPASLVEFPAAPVPRQEAA